MMMNEVLILLFKCLLPLVGETWATSCFEASSFLVIRESSIICVDSIRILLDFDGDMSASDHDSSSKDRGGSAQRRTH